MKIKLNVSGGSSGQNSPAISATLPKIKVKSGNAKIRLRKKEHGNGYDSEASDREEDPMIESEFILRMKPGADCEYLRQAIETKQIGDGADVWIKFKDMRRAVVSIRGHVYAAKLVDLPCIIESNKTFDKKNFYKTADISQEQMLLVGDRIEHEDTVLALPLKSSDHIYPHGITPPLRHVRKRRFRKRVSNRTIEVVEAEVDRLLKLDAEAEYTSFEVLDPHVLAREGSAVPSDIGSPWFGGGDDMEVDDDGDDDDFLAGQIEQSMMEVDPKNLKNVLTNVQSDESSESSEEDEEEDLDDESREKSQQKRLLQEEILELQATITLKRRDAENATNPILRTRFMDVVNKLQAELDMKLAQQEETEKPE
ncbi:Transcription initiation factor TFIID subunit 7 [Neolecta irregularis DAH-3]|uniref:Transcription initiation factor TFIID subunit 7 n=1 Tax=Neolecta irregularis (strain DAH-3) TaxID=1198029 RepID=A0A1U7LVH8_NEOID|nr:Transcription initiation factor TFIID subunit 7 [Neolecta irregularis DAH-3]|eukprot:OLL26521.1 Transcription initiation factor TFIID subunit 7 [Neolecta irregularis DAH-3]